MSRLMREHYDVAIVGSGVAGLSAAIWFKQLGVDAIVLEKEQQIGGQLHKIYNKIIDYPGMFGLKGSELLEQMTEHLLSMKCEWKTGVNVYKLATEEERMKLFTRLIGSKENEEESCTITSQYVVLATGAQERKLEIPGEAQLLSKFGTLSTSKDLELFRNKRVVIVGGGDRALEGAFRMKEIARTIQLIHHHDRFRAKDEYLKPVIDAANVMIRLFCRLTEVVWENDQLLGVKIRNVETNQEEEVEADYVLIRIGVEPNQKLVSDLVQFDEQRIHTDSYGCTSCHRIYAIGDVVNTSDFSSISLSTGQGMKVAKKIWLSMRARE